MKIFRERADIGPFVMAARPIAVFREDDRLQIPFYDDVYRINRGHLIFWQAAYRRNHLSNPFPSFVWPVLLVNNGHQIWSVLEMDTTVFNVKIHVAVEDEVIDFVLRDCVAPILFQFLRRLICDNRGIGKSGEVPNPG